MTTLNIEHTDLELNGVIFHCNAEYYYSIDDEGLVLDSTSITLVEFFNDDYEPIQYQHNPEDLKMVVDNWFEDLDPIRQSELYREVEKQHRIDLAESKYE